MLAERRCHTTLPVTDLKAAREFWEGQLGFTPVIVNDGAVMYRAGEDSRFTVTISAGRPAGTHTQLGFTVSDIGAEVADLQARGVRLEEYDLPGFKTENGIASTAAGRAAWFFDPARNLIGLVELIGE